VSVLSDRVLPKRRDEVLDEVHFFDPPPIPSLLPQRLRTLVDVLRLATGPQRPVAIRMKHVIQSRSHHPISQADRIYNVSDVYDRAHRSTGSRAGARRSTSARGAASTGASASTAVPAVLAATARPAAASGTRPRPSPSACAARP
jgi:hypothetical protein